MTIRSLAVALVLAVAAAPASAQISSQPRVLSPFKAVVAKANESTVQVRGDDKDIALGTVVYSDGFILTKASELRGALSVRFQDGTEFEAKIVGRHRDEWSVLQLGYAFEQATRHGLRRPPLLA